MIFYLHEAFPSILSRSSFWHRPFRPNSIWRDQAAPQRRRRHFELKSENPKQAACCNIIDDYIFIIIQQKSRQIFLTYFPVLRSSCGNFKVAHLRIIIIFLYKWWKTVQACVKIEDFVPLLEHILPFLKIQIDFFSR